MIDSQRVSEIFQDCLFKSEEIVNGKPNLEPVVVDGIRSKFGLHPVRIKQHETEIKNYLNQLPDTFSQGWTFLNMCIDKNGDQWTAFHSVCEELMTLGIGIGMVSYCMPRDMWDALPGGLPYIQVEQISTK